jgi:hypothetical protein
VDERGRLLERLQQAIAGLVVHRLGGLDHEHPAGRLERRPRRRRDDRSLDVRHEHLRGARGPHPGQVGMGHPQDPLADRLLVRRTLGQQAGREGQRRRPLADARGAVEEIGVRRGTRRAERGAEDGERVRVALDPRQMAHRLVASLLAGWGHGRHRDILGGRFRGAAPVAWRRCAAAA